MALDKSIYYGKEHRKPYRGAKSIDRTCRNHGGCPCCEENRLHKNKKRLYSVNEKVKEFNNG